MRQIILALAALAAGVTAAESPAQTYEYIVVGSGPGGGPVAASLARAGHSVLLLEAGDDRSADPRITDISRANDAVNAAETRWDFFVRHHADPAVDDAYLRLVFRLPNGTLHVGALGDAPQGAKKLGVWYPRAGTLGGCSMHNAGVTELPADADWDFIADATGDVSWKSEKMRRYFTRLEKNNYVAQGTTGHGSSGWFETSQGGADWAGAESGADGTAVLRSIAGSLGLGANLTGAELQALLRRDINAPGTGRDTLTGVFGTVTHSTPNSTRISAATVVKAALADKGSKLMLQLDTLATKILFDRPGPTEKRLPRAIGVEYLQGRNLYQADPSWNNTQKGTPGRAFASREVIVAGGAFNTPQLLKLSGIGPKDELDKFGIPIVANRSGVGAHLGDNYEGGVVSLASRNLTSAGGMYVVHLKTPYNDGARDIWLWCGGFAFEGFWPGYPQDYGPQEFTCIMVHIPSHISAGSVLLRSTDPTEPPEINFHMFEDEYADQDLSAMLSAAKFVRGALQNVSSTSGLAPWTELHPCPGTGGKCSDAAQKDYLRKQVYSHHASGTAKMGAAKDPMAVVDSKFRVIGVDGLRVVDGSVFPRPPGAFPILPTFMISAKAAEVILNELE